LGYSHDFLEIWERIPKENLYLNPLLIAVNSEAFGKYFQPLIEDSKLSVPVMFFSKTFRSATMKKSMLFVINNLLKSFNNVEVEASSINGTQFAASL
jgi:hypothetical protein